MIVVENQTIKISFIQSITVGVFGFAYPLAHEIHGTVLVADQEGIVQRKAKDRSGVASQFCFENLRL